jgi:hypothetical protein
MDQRTNGWTNIVSYRGATSRLKTSTFKEEKKTIRLALRRTFHAKKTTHKPQKIKDSSPPAFAKSPKQGNPSTSHPAENKVVTKPQVQSNCDVTSFRHKQISQNFIVGTDQPMDGPTNGPTDQPSNIGSYRGATLRLKSRTKAIKTKNPAP